MKLDIRSLELGANRMVVKIPQEEVDATLAPLARDGQLEVDLYHNETETVVSAKVVATVTQECARCLCLYEEDIETTFSVTLKKGNPARNGTDDAEDDVLFYDEAEGLVDFSELVAQEIGVNLAMKPICDEGCKGMCSGCGTNLNEGPCQCKEKPVNPAWEALLKLKKES